MNIIESQLVQIKWCIAAEHDSRERWLRLRDLLDAYSDVLLYKHGHSEEYQDAAWLALIAEQRAFWR